jgi:pyruvate formate lyase activating enzyme
MFVWYFFNDRTWDHTPKGGDMIEARYYTSLDDRQVQCSLCPHYCRIAPGARGKCCVRKNRDATLYTLSYERAISGGIDPIEKKPLYHFLPGTTSFSIATAGCNLSCSFCQNSEISSFTGTVPGQTVPVQDVVDRAVSGGCRSIAYTYTEPTVFFEYACDSAVQARKKGLKNVFVTNGYTAPKAIDDVSAVLDAANIDLKAFTDEFYRTYTGGRLQPVCDAIRRYYDNGVHIEVTTLLIPEKNDSDDEIHRIAAFIADIDPLIPWHVSRFHPAHHMMDTPPTPPQRIHAALEIGRQEGLEYVYAGNLPSSDADVTRCHACNEVIIARRGYRVGSVHCSDGTCDYCGARVNVVT